MSTVIMGDSDQTTVTLDTSKVKYDYPNDLDLNPNSSFHKKLLNMLMQNARASRAALEPRFTAWRQIDETLSAFVKEVQKSKEDAEKTQKKLVVPISYALLETMVSQLIATFLEPPYFRYESVDPDDLIGSILLEKTVDVQTQSVYSGVGLALIIMFQDAMKYGIAPTHVRWHVEEGKAVVKEAKTFTGIFTGLFGKTEYKRKLKERTLFEGNVLDNIDPYNYFPDPNVPIHDIQNSEYVGWLERSNYVNVYEEELASDGDMFNVKYLKDINAESSLYLTERNEKTKIGTEPNDSKVVKPLDRIYMYRKLIPADYGLSDSEKPELWLFCVAGDKVITEARKIDLPHNFFPIVVCAPQVDGHQVAPISTIEVHSSIQEIINFLFSSRIENVSKVLNDMLIVDPMLINMKDMYKPGAGKLIRMKRNAWGKNKLDQAVKQLNIQDVTSQHLSDANYMIELIRETSGATEAMQGIQRKRGERITATEFQGTQSGAVTRMDKAVRLASMTSMTYLAYMFAANTQWFIQEDVTIKTKGRWEKELKETYGENTEGVVVEPADLSVNFDVISHDGTLIGNEYASSWIQLIDIISKNPELMQAFDMRRIVSHVAKIMGAKNFDTFLNTQPLLNQSMLGGQNVDEDTLEDFGGI